MLKKLRFRSGPWRDRPPLEIEPAPVTILVGPNNAGKSLALNEINKMCAGKHVDEAMRRVVQAVEVVPPTADELLSAMQQWGRIPSRLRPEGTPRYPYAKHW